MDMIIFIIHGVERDLFTAHFLCKDIIEQDITSSVFYENLKIIAFAYHTQPIGWRKWPGEGPKYKLYVCPTC